MLPIFPEAIMLALKCTHQQAGQANRSVGEGLRGTRRPVRAHSAGGRPTVWQPPGTAESRFAEHTGPPQHMCSQHWGGGRAAVAAAINVPTTPWAAQYTLGCKCMLMAPSAASFEVPFTAWSHQERDAAIFYF